MTNKEMQTSTVGQLGGPAAVLMLPSAAAKGGGIGVMLVGLIRVVFVIHVGKAIRENQSACKQKSSVCIWPGFVVISALHCTAVWAPYVAVWTPFIALAWQAHAAGGWHND